MRDRLTPFGIVTGVFVTLAVLAIIGLTVVYTGGYNVAATEDHTPLGRWVASTTMENSVKARASGIAEPRFTQAMIVRGGGEYKAMCAQCHGGPGVEAAEWTKGLLPQPPHLTHAASEWRSREIFWMLKHGIKMSAMPAFGGTHDDGTLWAITAFAKQLPGMSAERYASIPAEHGHGAGEGEGGGEDGHHGGGEEDGHGGGHEGEGHTHEH